MNHDADDLLRYKKSGINFALIVLAYLFAPLALVAVCIRIVRTRPNNNEMVDNWRLAGHSLYGLFVELVSILGYLYGMAEYPEEIIGKLLMALVAMTILLVVPAAYFFGAANRAKRHTIREAVRETKTVYCESCGAAASRSPGESGPCEYCGSAVNCS
ncbi:hypothetical protein [Paenibacillus glufosinatiresistens]|uniref:hypothetical protein n=1 Tax=Paenibacillus glufosinatiresistens TaxID=3070657 RepID=UPI00286DC6DB|nr:hypothetical protein [Paenibacillus sp. YX.27]